MTGKQVFEWLHQYYHEDINASTPVDEVNRNLVEEFDGPIKDRKVIGRYLKKAFPSIKKIQKRDPNDWTKCIYIYKGLGKQSNTHSPYTLKDISKSIPEGYFEIQCNERCLKIGHFINENDENQTVVEVEICNDGKVDVSFANKSILSQIGIGQQIKLDKISIESLFSSLKYIKPCKGVVMQNAPPDIYNKKNAIIEVQGRNSILIHSKFCEKIVKFSSFSSTSACIKCRFLVSHMVQKNSSDLHESPKLLTTHTENEVDDLHPQPISQVMELLHKEAPFLSSSQLSFIQTQLANSSVPDKHLRRWDSNMIQLCLSLWTRSPKTYQQLCCSGCMLLPSVSTLSRYKNAVDQQAGLNGDVFQWMYMEAIHRKLIKQGFYGGIVLDEMSIQEDIQIVKKGGKIKLVGFADLGAEDFSSTDKVPLANHVLQFIFHGFSGFRFPIAHFPTTQANAHQIYTAFWDIVSSLHEWGFHTLYASIDGASTNRSFIKANFEGLPTTYDMAARNAFDDQPVVFLADPSHLFKKIRNNLLKSGFEKWHTRQLMIGENSVIWKMWIDAYQWDKEHGLPIHHQLTNDHICPNKADVMRNHLAEEVLDSDMLNLMQSYKQHLGSHGSALDGAISLLEQTSSLISIFHDRRALASNDDRLVKLKEIQGWFKSWETKESPNHLMSWETREDVQFLTLGFLKLATMTSDLGISIKPVYINSDIVENHFCQQRGLYHGAGANPNYNQYRSATNSIILGQNVISNKSNASRRKSSQTHGALPFTSLCKKLRL